MDEDVKLTVVADAKQVPGEIRENVEKPFDQAGTVAEIMGKKATGALGGVTTEATKIGGLKFGESFAGQAQQAGMSLSQFATTVGAVAGALAALRLAKEQVVETIGSIGEAAGASKADVEKLQEFLRSIPTDPLEALQIWVKKVAHEIENYTHAEEKATLAGALHVDQMKAEEMSVADLQKAYDKLIGKLRERREEIDELVGASAKDIQRQAENVIEAIRRIEAKGALTAEAQERVKQMIQGALDAARAANEGVPALLQEQADKYQVVTSIAEEQIETDKKRAEQAEKTASQKAAAAAKEEQAARAAGEAEQERARVEIEAAKARQKAAEEAAAAKVKAANEEVAAAQAAVKAEEEIYGSRPDTNSAEGVSRLKQELSELDDIQQRAALSAEQLARKFDLEEQIRAAEVQRRSAAERQRALDAEEAAYQKLKAARDAMAAAEERALQASIDQLRLKEKQQLQTEQLTGSTTAMAEAAFKASMGIEDLGDALGAAGGPAGDMAGTTEEIAKALDEGKDSVEEMKEKVKDLQTEGLNPLLAQAREFLKIAPAIEAAFARISAAAAAIRMGG